MKTLITILVILACFCSCAVNPQFDWNSDATEILARASARTLGATVAKDYPDEVPTILAFVKPVAASGDINAAFWNVAYRYMTDLSGGDPIMAANLADLVALMGLDLTTTPTVMDPAVESVAESALKGFINGIELTVE